MGNDDPEPQTPQPIPLEELIEEVGRRRGILGSVFSRVKMNGVGLVQEMFLFVPTVPGMEPIKNNPREYPELKDYNVKRHKLTTSDNKHITIWEKDADTPDKPHYVLFQGNTGHWGDIIIDAEPPVARNINLQFLDEIAKTGAGFTAVNLRGYGDSEGKPSEKGFERDIKAVVEHLLDKKKINSERIIVAGESLGTATSTMAAVEMTKRQQPPAMLCLMNPFYNMTQQVYEVLPQIDIGERLKVHPYIGKHLKLYPKMDEVSRILKHTFDTGTRIESLSTSTHVVVGTSLGDTFVRPDNSEKLVNKMRAHHLDVKRFTCPGDHNHWPRDEFVKVMAARYEQLQQDRHTHAEDTAGHTARVQSNGSGKGQRGR